MTTPKRNHGLRSLPTNPHRGERQRLRDQVNVLADFQAGIEVAHNDLVDDVQQLNREMMFDRFGIEALLLLIDEQAKRRWWQFWQRPAPVMERFAAIRQECADRFAACVSVARGLRELGLCIKQTTVPVAEPGAAAEGERDAV